MLAPTIINYITVGIPPPSLRMVPLPLGKGGMANFKKEAVFLSDTAPLLFYSASTTLSATASTTERSSADAVSCTGALSAARFF